MTTTQDVRANAENNYVNAQATATSSPPVLLMATVRWPNVALLAVELAKAGCDVSVVCPASHPLLRTRAVRRTFPYRSLRPLDALKAAIESAKPRIVIPCDDRVVQHLHELHAEARRSGSAGNKLAALIEDSLGSPASYQIVFARSDFLRIAREEGLLVPETEAISSLDSLRSWQMRQPFPWVFKTDGTYGGSGVKIAHTSQQAEKFLRSLSRYYTAGRAIKRALVDRDTFWIRPWRQGVRPAISVQAYIRGRPANCGVVCWKGKVLAGICVEVVRTAGPTGPATVVRVVNNADMRLSAERIAGRLGLSGFFGLDFMIEDGSGSTYLIEVNPRPTRVTNFQLGEGRDPVGALVTQLSGQTSRNRPPVTQKEMIAYFPDALDCSSELLRSSFQDAPEGEPDLVQELLRPWPPKGLLWHLVNQLDQVKKRLRGSDAHPESESQG